MSLRRSFLRARVLIRISVAFSLPERELVWAHQQQICGGRRSLPSQIASTVLRWRTLIKPLFQGVLYLRRLLVRGALMVEGRDAHVWSVAPAALQRGMLSKGQQRTLKSLQSSWLCSSLLSTLAY
jgi:hypothetical protein